MKRRSFIAGSAASVISLGVLPLTSAGKRQRRIVHNSSAMETTIMIDGLTSAFNVVQITDSHISCDSENEKQYEQYSQRMDSAYKVVTHYKTNERIPALEMFKQVLNKSKEFSPELIALTGDIVNNPSETSIKAVKSEIDKLGIPYIYTPGNHDWHYEGMSGSADQLRSEWSKKRLQVFTNDTLFSSTILNGVNFVAIDNSTYQINKQQLEFFKEQLKKDKPIILLAHIPLYMPSLDTSSCGHPDWGWATDTIYEIERRERWQETNNKETVEFVKLAMDSSMIAGIFSGHWHESRTIIHNNRVQYITDAGCRGAYRLIKFKGLK